MDDSNSTKRPDLTKAWRAERLELARTEEKRCVRCHRVLALASFDRRTASVDGRFGVCKECRRAPRAAFYAANQPKLIAISAAWREANPDRPAENTKAWRKANAARRADQRSRRRARKAAASIGPVDLSKIPRSHCGICQDPIDPDLAYPDPMSASLDHIIPLVLGGSHEQSNLQWSHLLCNVRKGSRPIG